MSGSSWLRFAQRSGYRGLFLLTFATSPSILAEIHPSDCARAAQYSERRRGVSMLVIQNGRTVFEHYANGGSATGRWPIFSGTKSFWGIAALAAVRDGFFKLDDPVSDMIAEWKSDSRKSQITIRQLLNQTDGIEGASRLQRASIRDRNAMAIWLNQQAPNGREMDMERMLDLPWQNAQWTDACICKDAPADMVVALGSGYQRLFVIPSLKAIIVRQGSNTKFSDAHFLRLVLGREG